MTSTLLGGLTAKRFLARHWQKRPLLVRNAIPGFRGLMEPQELFALVGDENVESRLVEQCDGAWRLQRGPLRKRELARRRGHPWTVLVQGVNLFVGSADALLRRFHFIPYARLDDLMISYAVDGGGVGPHVDAYDVFLLQGMGIRRWQISARYDPTLIEGAPLKILRHFRPSQEWVLEPGDLLYLPPYWAHNGVAEGECMTYSIGFRTPSARELVTQFLVYLQDRLEMEGMYRDPDLRPQRHPAAISTDMVDEAARMIGRLRWNRNTVRDYLGCYLTEAKPHVHFSAPAKPLGRAQFLRRCRKFGLSLNTRTQLLFAGPRFYINGDSCSAPSADRLRLRRLADVRRLERLDGLSDEGLDLLYQWYRCGFAFPSG